MFFDQLDERNPMVQSILQLEKSKKSCQDCSLPQNGIPLRVNNFLERRDWSLTIPWGL
jgi:hypothetical protein